MLWNRSNDFLKFVLALACAWVLIPAQTVSADEKDEKGEAESTFLQNFITELRLNGFADLGIYYLEQRQKDGTLPEKFKPEYDFELAVQTEASSNLAKTYDERLERLDEAIKLLDKYIAEHPEGANYYIAIGLLPNCRLNKTLVYLAKCDFNSPFAVDDSKFNEEEKKELEKRKAEFTKNVKVWEESARKELAANVEFLTKYEKLILDNAKKLNPDDEAQNAKRNDMLNELHSIRMARANTYYELSKTYPAGSKEKNENLDKARLQYKFFWDKYREAGLLIAFRGHVSEAKMLIEMKKYAGKGEAIEILGDLYTGLKDLVSQDAILREVFVDVCTCYLKIFSDKEAGVKPDKDQQVILMESIENFDPSKAGSILRSYSMENTSVGLQMRLAYVQFMEYFLELNKPKDEAKRRAALKEDVRRMYILPSNPFRNEIYELHKKYFPEEHIGDEDTTLTFANYRKEMKQKQAANLKKKADKRENLYLELRKFALKEFSNFFKARTELQQTQDEARKKELQQIVTENPPKILEVFDMLESMKYDMLRAKQFEILTIDRFYRAQMFYVMGKQYEAIAMLDFIAKRYESSLQASNALFYELAYMNALIVNEYRELKKQMQSGAVTVNQSEVIEMFRGELELLASCILMKEKMFAAPDKYGLNEVDSAGQPVPKPLTKDPMAFEWERLCKLCLMVGAVDLAQEYITKIPAENENRAALELSIGFSLWNMYIEFKRADDDNKPFTLEEADRYQKLALELLESGAQKLKKQVKTAEDVTDTVLSAAMTLCESYSRRGDNKNAITWLRDEKIGPYKLLCDNHPTVTDARKDRILNIALVAFVSENDMESAFDAMDRLEKLAAADTEGDMDEKLTRKYMSLGFQLRDNLQSMVASGDEKTLEQVKVVQAGFEEFLKRIQARENGNSYASMNWIAQTFVSLAEGSQESGANAVINEESKKYYEAAIETYKTMLGHLKDDPDFVTNADEEKIANLTLGLQRKIAETSESLGNYEMADEYYRMVLEAKPGLMALQYRMMNMYIAWSRSVTDDMKLKGNLLVQARQGIRSADKKKSICRGWGGMIRGLNDYILPGSDPQKRWMYYYVTLRDAEVNYLFGLAKGGYSDEMGKKAIDMAFNSIRSAYDGGDGSSEDFGGSVAELDADGMPTDAYVEKDGLVYEPLAGKYESLLKRIQEARGEDPTGFAGWTREVVEETPADEDAFTAAQIEDNAQLEELENSRLANEEDFARKMMTPKAKPTPPYVIYTSYGVGGVAVLIVLFLIMRGGGGRSAKRRKQLLAAAKVPTDASGFKVEEADNGPVALGIGDEVVDSSAGANALASLGIGDAPVILEEEKQEEAPVFSFDFGAPAPAA
ncbi:MAG: hypothetical protein Q4C70_11925, partial [Planctomycetia bacterium]|nr:hypothetical protein [Planctomycetia bacterium]